MAREPKDPTDDPKSDAGKAGASTGRKARKPVTIDLKAEDVTAKKPKPDPKAETSAKSESDSSAKPASEAALKPATEASSKAAPEHKSAASETAKKSDPAAEPVKTAAETAAPPEKPGKDSEKKPAPGANAAKSEAKVTEPPPKGPITPPRAGQTGAPEASRPPAAPRETPEGRGAGLFVSALSGAIAAALILALALASGLVGRPTPPDTTAADAVSALGGEITTLRDTVDANAAAGEEALAAFRLELDVLAKQVDGLPATPTDSSQAQMALAARIDALEAKIESLQAPADAPDSAPAADLAPLAARIAALEQAIASGAAGGDAGLESLASRLAALEAGGTQAADAAAALRPEIEAIGEDLAAIGPRIEALEARTPPDLAPLTAAVDGLKNDLAALSERIGVLDPADRIAALGKTVSEADARAQRAVDSAAAVAPAIAALSLADALAAGRPFATELKAAQVHGAADADTATIKPFAETGLPTLPALRARFAEIAPTMVAEKPPVEEPGNPLQRLVRSARDLVEVRPVGPLEGDDPFAVVSRISDRLAAGDLAAAHAEWLKLPDEQRSASVVWADQVAARIAGDRIATTLRDDAIARLAAGDAQ